MTTVDIYRGTDLFVSIKPEDSSTQQKKIMGENLLNITFKLNHYANFQINDWTTVFNEIYKVNELPIVKKLSQYLYEYTLILKVEGVDLSKVQYLFLGDDNSLKESEFSLMGNADTFIDLLLTNLTRLGTGWVKGQVIPTGYKNLTFSKENCYNALGRIAEAFDTEFAIEGKVIHLTARGIDRGFTFKHGKNKGLYDITRTNVDNSSVVTRLYAYGAAKNLPNDYRNFSQRLKMPLVDFVERNVDKYGLVESTQIFDDIYPHRTGTVTSVNAANVYQFIDFDIDFNINTQLIPGVSAKIVFNTGNLAGYQFEISKFDNATKTFTILKNKDEKAIDVPSASLKPAIGDQYVLVDIIMPQTYIDAAETELQQRAAAALVNASEPQVTYAITFDPVYLRKKQLTLNIGDLVWLEDSALEILRKIRITSTTRNIVNEFEVSVELSDVVQFNVINRLLNTTSSQGRDIQQVQLSLVNNSLLNGIGIFPPTTGGTGFKVLVVEVATGKIYMME